MKIKKLSVLLVTAVVLSLFATPAVGCAPTNLAPTSASYKGETGVITTAETSKTFNEQSATKVVMGNVATVSGNGARADKKDVIINSEGDFLISGSANNAVIKVDAPKKAITLVLDNLSITNKNFATIYVLNAKTVYLLIRGNCQLKTTDSFVNRDSLNNVDGVIFAKSSLVIDSADGSALSTLEISSSANGIVSKDDCLIDEVNVIIESDESGIDCNDSYRQSGGNVEMVCKKDGVHVQNLTTPLQTFVYMAGGVLKIECANDGVDCFGTFEMYGGQLNVVAGGGLNKPVDALISQKGIKVGVGAKLAGGVAEIVSPDDAIQSDGVIALSASLKLSAGDDGVSATTNLDISGGDVTVLTSYEGLTAQKINVTNGNIQINSTDDAINASIGSNTNVRGDIMLKISGGTLFLNAVGQGMDSNGGMQILGGTIVVLSRNSIAPLESHKSAEINGGVLFVASDVSKTEKVDVFGKGMQSRIVCDGKNASRGNCVISCQGQTLFTYELAYAPKSILFSSPDLEKGQTYKVSLGTAEKEITL